MNRIVITGLLSSRHRHLTRLLLILFRVTNTCCDDVRRLRRHLARLLLQTCRDLWCPTTTRLRLPLWLLGAASLRCSLLRWASIICHCCDRDDASDRDHLHDLCAFSAHLTIDSGGSGILHSCTLRRLPYRHSIRQLHQLDENIPLLIADFNIVARIHYTELAVVKRRTAAAYLIITSSLLYLHNLTQRLQIIK